MHFRVAFFGRSEEDKDIWFVFMVTFIVSFACIVCIGHGYAINDRYCILCTV